MYNKKGEIIKESYLSIVYKGEHLYTQSINTTLEKDYIIHTFPEQYVKTVNQLHRACQMPHSYSKSFILSLVFIPYNLGRLV